MAGRQAKVSAFAKGGDVEESKMENYNGSENNVEKEAEEKNKGGKVKKRAAGGSMMEGSKARHRLDRRGRKRGGSVGSDMHPLSSAAGESGGREENKDDGDTKGDYP